MVNAKEWLDKEYPRDDRCIGEFNWWDEDKERREIHKLIIIESLIGELDLSDFTNLEKICLYPSVREDKLKIVNKPKNAEIIRPIEAQEYLEKYYPQDGICQLEKSIYFHKKRSEIGILFLNGENLTGSLLIRDWTRLRQIIGGINQLTSLTIINCPYLEKVSVDNNHLTELTITECGEINELNLWNNYLTNWDFLTNCQLEKLSSLWICDNKFSPQDLTALVVALNQFNNFEILVVDNNPFFGSLASLQNLGKLKELWIRGTNLTGLEYLPDSVGKICCDGSLAVALKDYKHIRNSYYYYGNWRKGHPELIANAQRIMELEAILANLNSTLINSHTQNQTINQGLQIFIFETQSKINELRKQNQDYYQSQLEIPPKSN